jgi:hypothetical protein
MAMIPGPLITGPESVASRYGLLVAASGPISLPEKARGGGVRYIPVTCGVAHTYPIDCSGGAVLTPDKDADEQNPMVETGSFAAYASIECGAIGYTQQEFTDQVIRRLYNGEQGAAEYALWSGLGADGNPLGIQNLTDDAVAVTNPDDSDIVAVLAALEDYAYRVQGYGQVAYIHAPASMAAWANDRHIVETRSGDPRKYTPFGSVWVFGGGYPGTGPAHAAPPAGGAYLYVTGQVTVWRSDDVWTYPVNQTMDRETNQHFLLSEREYVIGFDCFAGSALFNPLGGS